jgi:hypothetical protein
MVCTTLKNLTVLFFNGYQQAMVLCLISHFKKSSDGQLTLQTHGEEKLFQFLIFNHCEKFHCSVLKNSPKDNITPCISHDILNPIVHFMTKIKANF